jgi:hypothetical protein
MTSLIIRVSRENTYYVRAAVFLVPGVCILDADRATLNDMRGLSEFTWNSLNDINRTRLRAICDKLEGEGEWTRFAEPCNARAVVTVNTADDTWVFPMRDVTMDIRKSQTKASTNVPSHVYCIHDICV